MLEKCHFAKISKDSAFLEFYFKTFGTRCRNTRKITKKKTLTKKVS